VTGSCTLGVGSPGLLSLVPLSAFGTGPAPVLVLVISSSNYVRNETREYSKPKKPKKTSLNDIQETAYHNKETHRTAKLPPVWQSSSCCKIKGPPNNRAQKGHSDLVKDQ
jgi:hypothetical protein